MAYLGSETVCPQKASGFLFTPVQNTSDFCCKLSIWSDKTTISPACQNWLVASSTKPIGRAGRSIGFGRVSEGVRSEGAVNTGSGSSKKTGTEFTWSCESDTAAGQALLYSISLVGKQPEGERERPLAIWSLVATCLFTLRDLVSPDMLWRNNVNSLVRGDFQPIVDPSQFPPHQCEAVTGRLFYGRWGSEPWYQSPGFARRPIWS